MTDTVPGVPPFLHVMARCDRFGTYLRWRAQDGMQDHRPKRVISWWGPMILDRNVKRDALIRSDRCPVDIEEALETGKCIAALPQTMRDAIIEEHVIGGTQAEKCEHLEIERTTLWRRRQAAYPRLLELFQLASSDLPLES